MLRVPLDGCCETERVVRRKAAGARDVDHSELALRQRAGLVEDHSVQVPGLLQASPIPNKQAALCRSRR